MAMAEHAAAAADRAFMSQLLSRGGGVLHLAKGANAVEPPDVGMEGLLVDVGQVSTDDSRAT